MIRTLINRTIVLIAILALLFSCSNRRSNSDAIYVYSIDPTNRALYARFDDLFDRIELIPFETRDDVLMSSLLRNVQFTNNQIVVLDRVQQKIMFFDKNGTFERAISRQGRGPGEYIDAPDYYFDEKSGNTLVLTMFAEVYIYDKELRFIDSYKLPDRAATDFQPVSENIIVWISLAHMTSGLPVMYIYDISKDEIISETELAECLRTYSSGMMSTFYSPFVKYEDRYLAILSQEKKILEINPETGELSEYIFFDFGRYSRRGDCNLFEERLYQASRAEAEDFRQNYPWNNKVYSLTSFFETNDRIAVNYFFYDRFNLGSDIALINKKTGKYSLISRDFDFKRTMALVHMDDEGIYFIVDAHEINDYVDAKFMDQRNIAKLNSIAYDDNPVIVKYVFKK